MNEPKLASIAGFLHWAGVVAAWLAFELCAQVYGRSLCFLGSMLW